MNIGLIIRTVRHLKPTQVWYQILYRIRKSRISNVTTPIERPDFLISQWTGKPISYLGNNTYSFLNIEHIPTDSNDASKGMLWAYNLNYMDYLLQPDINFTEAKKLVFDFINNIDTNKVGLDPYPIALRGINWIKWLTANTNSIENRDMKVIMNSLYSQYKCLSRKIEWHLMGNHLLEDAYSLTIAAIYFSDKKMWHKASNLLKKQLNEQILKDGAHYEQSPMYHCILLDRLLDVYNVSVNNQRFGADQDKLNEILKVKAIMMLGHLESISWADGTYPLINDSAMGIAPTPDDLKVYATRLGLDWTPLNMRECGYRKLLNNRLEAIVDIGNITAPYQPGHTHADTFNYELRIDGMPFVVDTGVSTYDKTPRRQYERSTLAHNTVNVQHKDSSEVWGGFRVGHRAHVTITLDSPDIVEAKHNGYGIYHNRRFEMSTEFFSIEDSIDGNITASSIINLDTDVKVLSVTNNMVITDKAVIEINGASEVAIEDILISREYNIFQSSKRIRVDFNKKVSYRIRISG